MNLNRKPNGTVIAIMVVWNGIPYLERALSSLLENLREEDDLLVVDNDSSDGSAEFIQKYFPQIALLQTTENLGGAGGFNEGAKIALTSNQCKFVWLLDNDIYLEKNALLPLISACESNEVAAAGSQICLYKSPDIIQEIGGKYSLWLGSLSANFHNTPRLPKNAKRLKVDYLAACSLLIRTDVIRNYGLFNNFFIFYDDVEWGLRMNSLGLSCVAVPESVIHHNFSGLKPISAWREYYRKRNRCYCLLLTPPKNGKYLALWIYMIYLNYLIAITYWSKEAILHNSYMMARIDFLQRRLGKNIAPVVQTNPEIPSKDGCLTYLLDIGSLGNTIHIADRISKLSTEYKILSTQFSNKELGICKTQKKPNSKDNVIAIIDRHFSLKTLMCSSLIYQHTEAEFIEIKHPLKHYFLILAGKIISIVPSIIIGSLDAAFAYKQLPKLQNRYIE